MANGGIEGRKDRQMDRQKEELLEIPPMFYKLLALWGHFESILSKFTFNMKSFKVVLSHPKSI